MKKWLKVITSGLLVVLAGIQFFPASHNTSTQIPPEDFVKTFKPPREIENSLKIACYDCHSNNTRYPWYSHIQPAAWLMAKHITEGKAELNFNELGAYSERKQKSKLKAMAGQIENGEMPLWSYTIIHREGILSRKEKKNIMAYLDSLRENL